MSIQAVEPTTVQGVEMGVLPDGSAFFTARGLAQICGVVPSVILEWTPKWRPDSVLERDQKLTRLLESHGYQRDELFERATIDGKVVHCFPEPVSMSIIEYYAFEASTPKAQAQINFRTLARAGMRAFVYRAVGYDPRSQVPDGWRKFHDRLLLNSPPRGMFSVFQESASMVLDLIRHGLSVDEHTIPDASVGKLWSKFWTENELGTKFGARSKSPHKFPDYFPQAKANAVIEAWVYPATAVGEFRAWLDSHYYPEKLPNYLKRKVKSGSMAPAAAELVSKALAPPGEG